MIDYALERKKIYRQCFAPASPKSPMVYLLGRVLQPTTRPITHDAGAPSITRPPAVRLRNITLCDGAFGDSSPCSMSEHLRQDQPHGGADSVQFRTSHRLLDSQDFTAPEAAWLAAGLQALPGVRRRHQRPPRHEIIAYHEYPCSPPNGEFGVAQTA